MAALAQPVERLATALLEDARNARLQRSLSLVAGLAAGLSGLEVAYMHYRGSYSRRVMYTPLATSTLLIGAG
ncbi:MAG: hypothetical protein ACRD2D_03545, partial [Terriglobales bacterium]